MLLALAGCGRVGFDPLGAADGGIIANGDGAVALWPSLPLGCPVLTDATFDVSPPVGWGITDDTPLIADPTAPSGRGVVADFVYPPGFTGGVAPAVIYFDTISSDARELYVGVIWKVSSPWQGHGSGYNALLYIQQDDGTTVNNTVYQFRGPPYDLGVSYDMTYDPNVADPTLTLGAWHMAEIHIAPPGTIEWWHDGVLVGRETAVPLADVPFAGVSVQPIWGGIGDTKTELDHLWVDQAIVCAR